MKMENENLADSLVSVAIQSVAISGCSACYGGGILLHLNESITQIKFSKITFEVSGNEADRKGNTFYLIASNDDDLNENQFEGFLFNKGDELNEESYAKIEEEEDAMTIYELFYGHDVDSGDDEEEEMMRMMSHMISLYALAIALLTHQLIQLIQPIQAIPVSQRSVQLFLLHSLHPAILERLFS